MSLVWYIVDILVTIVSETSKKQFNARFRWFFYGYTNFEMLFSKLYVEYLKCTYFIYLNINIIINILCFHTN